MVAVTCVITKKELIPAPVSEDIPSTQTAGHVAKVISNTDSVT